MKDFSSEVEENIEDSYPDEKKDNLSLLNRGRVLGLMLSIIVFLIVGIFVWKLSSKDDEIRTAQVSTTASLKNAVKSDSDLLGPASTITKLSEPSQSTNVDPEKSKKSESQSEGKKNTSGNAQSISGPPVCDTPEKCTHPMASQALSKVKIMTIVFIPDANSDGIVDQNTGYSGSVKQLKSKIRRMNTASAWWLTESTKFRDKGKPSIYFENVRTIQRTDAVPIGMKVPWNNAHRPDYRKILNEEKVCDYVNSGVSEVWIWTQHHGNIEPAESNLSSPIGDYSNSEKTDDLPKCSKSYTVYNYNFTRSSAEPLHNRGHQYENIIRAFNPELWNKFEKACGNTHFPPNGTKDYDYNNPNPKVSNCEGFLNGTNDSSTYTCSTYFKWTYGDPNCFDDGGLAYYVWWFQQLPGRDSKTLDGKPIRNWWDVTSDLDGVISKDWKK